MEDQPVGAGCGSYFCGNKTASIDVQNALNLRFEITHSEVKTVTHQENYCVATQEFEWPENQAVLRLDQVTFPPGAVAWRHTHAGAGFRHLVMGELEIKSDHHVQSMRVGDSWFEDAHSPVRAEARESGYTQFVRAMIIPIEYLGKPTIQILEPEDAIKPARQKNHRFLDQIIEL